MVAQLKEENVMESKKVSCFYCYNPKLRIFLQNNGLSWIDRDINTKSGFPYWTFAQSGRLSELIIAYKEEK